MAEQCTTVPRTVTAAQWSPRDLAAAGDVVGLAYTAGATATVEDDGRLVVAGAGESLTLRAGDWLIWDGSRLARCAAAEFRAGYQRHYAGGVRNSVNGSVTGTLIQTGDYHGDVSL